MIRNFSYNELKSFLIREKNGYVNFNNGFKNKINENFKYLTQDLKNGIHWNESPVYMCFIEDDILKGVLKYVYPWKETLFKNDNLEYVCLFYIETNSKFKNQKIASALSESIFSFCKKENKPFMSSYYTDEGASYIQKIFQRMSLKYDVPFLDRKGFDYVWFNKH